MMWKHGFDFLQAVTALTDGSVPAAKLEARSSHTLVRGRPEVQPEQWRRKAEQIVREAQALLWEPEGAQAQMYLSNRGLEPQTLLQFGLGYRQDVPVPGTRGRQPAPAIVIPWYEEGKLVAIRYRFLETQTYLDADGKTHSEKQTSEPGSKFSGHLFGEQGLFGGLQKLRWLLICEGEFNAMSCWQVAYETGLDVLCIGSESATLPASVVKSSSQYRCVFVWADKEAVVLTQLKKIPHAVGIKSPGEKDANDLLQAGNLGGLLAFKRDRAARHDDDREALLWGLYDAAMLLAGIDTNSAAVLRDLAKRLGKRAEIYQPKPDEDRWITTWIPS